MSEGVGGGGATKNIVGRNLSGEVGLLESTARHRATWPQPRAPFAPSARRRSGRHGPTGLSLCVGPPST